MVKLRSEGPPRNIYSNYTVLFTRIHTNKKALLRLSRAGEPGRDDGGSGSNA